MAELLLHYMHSFFSLVAARPRQTATVTTAATAAAAATATRWVDQFGLATRYMQRIWAIWNCFFQKFFSTFLVGNGPFILEYFFMSRLPWRYNKYKGRRTGVGIQQWHNRIPDFLAKGAHTWMQNKYFFLQHYFCNFELANFIDKGCTGAPKGIKNVQLSGGMQGFTGTMSPYICSKGCHGKMGTSM